ncbi:unnamed protein product [Microthlaspi erraticum]|uniref:F-box domain-containing protein n=1 Tax=Microthlaspi erraticum TaxID=1685480 RepID=A0A6D2J8V8_9BRAS|nr:unnamed protein product [Microthlaspi erraticum]CAA7060186.1 unnamed protein product [Microthlaspi erraticum]
MSSETKAEDEQSSESPFEIMSLPQDVIVDIIARVPRCKYLTLSFVSKHFRSLVASPKLYASRSLLGFAEQCLYVLLTNNMTGDQRWYTLYRKPYGGYGLVLIPSLPAMPWFGRFVTVGSRVYVFSGSYNHHKPQDALSIDCRSHTVQTLPSMPIHMTDTVAGVIDGKIYVTGWSHINKGKVMVVFNTETLMWEPEMTKRDIELGDTKPSGVVVMGDKIYRKDHENNVVYKPVENTWESFRYDMLNYDKWENKCVVDDVLYYYDHEKHLTMHDPKKRYWRVVNGLEKLWAWTKWSGRISQTVSYGGKLALFFTKRETGECQRQIWCAEISLEKRQGGEIWGKVEWCGEVLSSWDLELTKALAVML